MDSLLRPTTPRRVPLLSLADGLGLRGDTSATADVTGITQDSRSVRPGWLYVGLPGTRMHGASFAEQAAAAGY